MNLLFETAPPLADALFEAKPFESYTALIDKAASIIAEMSQEDKLAVINAHPPIGVKPAAAANLSAFSYQEQGLAAEAKGQAGDAAALEAVYAELGRLNEQYTAKHGFPFVVFVNGRSKAELIPVLKERMDRSDEVELAEGIQAMLDIARDRLKKMTRAPEAAKL